MLVNLVYSFLEALHSFTESFHELRNLFASEEEEDYHASVTNAVTLFAIPLVIQSTERASAVFECLASEGYRQVSPVVFEQA